ncbi:MAG: hypothetical protein EZS28_048096 [Streblomastix strix]|uniref:Uncharacterized protein n=1 Tax=Streblomastix strix TaxID=222440 RepID=A0A5J4TDZ6_9EUKA|nr:MAG: hypothetical protein EZS28_048096 [Streblomastix strix]
MKSLKIKMPVARYFQLVVGMLIDKFESDVESDKRINVQLTFVYQLFPLLIAYEIFLQLNPIPPQYQRLSFPLLASMYEGFGIAEEKLCQNNGR